MHCTSRGISGTGDGPGSAPAHYLSCLPCSLAAGVQRFHAAFVLIELPSASTLVQAPCTTSWPLKAMDRPVNKYEQKINFTFLPSILRGESRPVQQNHPVMILQPAVVRHPHGDVGCKLGVIAMYCESTLKCLAVLLNPAVLTLHRLCCLVEGLHRSTPRYMSCMLCSHKPVAQPEDGTMLCIAENRLCSVLGCTVAVAGTQHSRATGCCWVIRLTLLDCMQWFQDAGFEDVKIKRIGPKWYRGVRRHGLIMGCSVIGHKRKVQPLLLLHRHCIGRGSEA